MLQKFCRDLASIAVVITWLLIASTSACATEVERRHAFVVGVGKYMHINSLQTAETDANDVSTAFRKLPTAKYNVQQVQNPTIADFETEWQSFVANLKRGDIAVVYFAGHGIEADNKNFLAMADAHSTVTMTKDNGFYPLQELVDALTVKGVVPIIVLDACRNDPLKAAQAFTLGGLAEVKPPPGGAILFAAAARQSAIDFLRVDSAERNGLFTSSFLTLLGRTDLTFELLAAEIKFRVWQQANSAGRNQAPAFWSDIHSSICLAGPCTLRTEAVSPEAATHDCDAVAGHPDDKRHGKAGVFYTELDGFLAFSKCRAAVDLNPGKSRMIYQLGRALDRLKSFKESFDHAKLSAEMGDPEGMSLLGVQYRDGEGVSRDLDLAKSWFTKGVEAGSTTAMVQLGLLHETGIAGAVDLDLAFSLLKRAAAKGNVSALVDIGNAYEHGRGVERNPAKAFEYWEAAAQKRHPAGYGNVGWAYAAGIGVNKDYAKAAKWLRKAEEKGNLSAVRNLGSLFETGRLGAVDRAEALRRYKAVYDDGRDSDEKSKAAVARGTYYEKGWVVRNDVGEAVKLYREAIDINNNSQAHWKLGALYLNGRIGNRTETDYLTGLGHINTAIEHKNQGARTALGWAYQYGLGVKPNLERAREEYEIAARHEEATALNNLGNLILEATDDPAELERARKYFDAAYAQRNRYGAYNLGRMYSHGVGVESDVERGVALLGEAVEWGHPTARRQLCWYSYARSDIRALEPPGKNWCDQLVDEPGDAAEARFLRGLRSYRDKDGDQNAQAHLREAARLGMADAKCELDVFLDRDAKTESDFAEAVEMHLACASMEWKYVYRIELASYSERFRRKLQEQLKFYGLYSGPIDGIFGPETSKAWYAWRKRGISKQRAEAAGRAR